jgi:signal peptidase I
MIIGRNWRITLLRAAIWAVVCSVIFKIALLRVEVDGISMAPTYKDHSKNWINRLAYIRHEPQRGDVVAIRFSRENSNNGWFAFGFRTPHLMLLKRIVALPGETIAFENGRVLINGQILDEPYEKQVVCNWNIPPVTLAADEYYVVGDNRSMPEENHTKGRCKRGQILGKILL